MYSSSIQSRLLRFGYQFLGPFLVDWYNRLATASSGIETDRVYLLGREGWNLVPLFNTIEAMQFGARRRFVYLHTSRALLTHISLSDPQWGDWSFGLRFTGTVRQFFESRLGLHFELLQMPDVGDQHVVLPRDQGYVSELFGRSRAAAQAFAAKSREAYGKYLTARGFKAGSMHVISDLGFRGTTQALLSALYNYRVTGYYALLDPAGVPEAPPLVRGSVNGLFVSNKSFGQNYAPLDSSLLIESFLTAPFGQIIGIQHVEHGDPFLYRDGGPAQKNFSIISECVQGAHKFAMDNFDLLGSKEVLIDDFLSFFESFRDAISRDLELFAPILFVDDSYYGVSLSDVRDKL